MQQAKAGDTVRVHYTGSLADGSVFDTSVGGDPLQFTVGSGMVIPGFDEAVVGMEAGGRKRAEVPPGEAYGMVNEDMVFKVERSKIPAHIKPEIGMVLHVGASQEEATTVTVTAMDEEGVTLDGNHALAGKTLIFDLELLQIL